MAKRTVTILLVEDDDQLRALLKQVADYQGRIHLMISDIMMPGATGYELAKRLRTWRPDMKMLFMSGYPKEVLCEEGLLERDAPFLQKPFEGHTHRSAIDQCRAHSGGGVERVERRQAVSLAHHCPATTAQ